MLDAISIQTRHVSITDALKEYAREKAEKVTKYYDNIQRIVLELSILEGNKHSQIVKATVMASQTVIRATFESGDMYASIDGVEEKITKQLKKHHDKLRTNAHKELNHRSGGSPSNAAAYSKPQPLCLDKPTFVDDAITHLETGLYPFVVFRDAQSRKVSIVYESCDGVYTVIEPEN